MSSLSVKIAEAVDTAWHGHHGSGRIEIPIGVVATLTLLLPSKADADRASREWDQMTAGDFCSAVEQIWAKNWLIEPYLTTLARPVWSWAEHGLSDQQWTAARAVAKAAIKHGVWTITNHADPGDRAEEDLLGVVTTELRSRGARKSLGEYHTPPDVAQMMAEMIIGDFGDIKPGMGFHEPAAGTGGMLRAVAQVLRQRGHDPAQMTWAAIELEPIAAACLAVNAMLWGLGPNVLIWQGDALAEGNAIDKAVRQKRQILEHYRTVRDAASTVAAIIAADALLGRAANQAGAA